MVCDNNKQDEPSFSSFGFFPVWSNHPVLGQEEHDFWEIRYQQRAATATIVVRAFSPKYAERNDYRHPSPVPLALQAVI
jgi:hypothetical protein